jgi:hypothetical protein
LRIRGSHYSWLRVDDAYNFLATLPSLPTSVFAIWHDTPQIADSLRTIKKRCASKASVSDTKHAVEARRVVWSQAPIVPREGVYHICDTPSPRNEAVAASITEPPAPSSAGKSGVWAAQKTKGEDECEIWLRGLIARGEQPKTRDATLALASRP